MGTDATIKNIRTGKHIFVDRLKNILNEHTIGTDSLNLLQDGLLPQELLTEMMQELYNKNPDSDSLYLSIIDEVKAFPKTDFFKLLSENDEEYWE